MKARPECGTYSGYQAHTRRGEPHCGPCKVANAAYVRQIRQRDQWWRAGHAARLRALKRLSHLHPDEYRDLYAEELGKEREAAS